MPAEHDALAIVPRRRDLVRRLDDQLRASTVHQRFAPTPLPWPDWINHTSQRHIRTLALDTRRDAVWMATWGGVLCWFPSQALCVRHTSEHGLVGNATRAIEVDSAGRVWAAGEHGGLCWLNPDRDTGWQPHGDLKDWEVLCLAPQEREGVYIAMRDRHGRCAVGELASPRAHLGLLMDDDLSVKNINALWCDPNGTLWIGNMWGLHRRAKDGHVNSFLNGEVAPTEQVCAISKRMAGGLWLGTRRGLFHFQPDEQQLRPQIEGWPRADVIRLSAEPETGYLWVLTAREVGRMTEDRWQPLSDAPRDRLNTLTARRGRAWAAGSDGMYDLGPDSGQPAFSLSTTMDTLGNMIQCLHIDSTAVWAGTAQGLYRFDGQSWRALGQELPHVLRDVRSLAAGGDGKLWVGTWAGGPAYMAHEVYVPDRSLSDPIMALAIGEQDEAWAATPDAIYIWRPAVAQWEPVQPAAAQHIGAHIIQTICFQPATSPNETPTLWVGTSSGLWRYRPRLQLWDAPADWGAPDELSRLFIQALAIDPNTNQLWVGTPFGLYGQRKWKHPLSIDVRALAFDSSPKGTLWIGTSTGLGQWPTRVQGKNFPAKPITHFTLANSGLGAEAITALAVRAQGDEYEVWVGTPAGASVYRYRPKKSRTAHGRHHRH